MANYVLYGPRSTVQPVIGLPLPILTLISATTATLTVGSAFGGTAPYTYQWHRSTITPNFTPGPSTIIGGAVSRTLNDSGLALGQLYYYRVQATDAVQNIATSPVAGAYTVPGTTVSVLGIGDSIMANVPHDTDNDLGLGDVHLCLYDPLKMACRYLEKSSTSIRKVNSVNAAVAGTTTADWLPAITGLSYFSYNVTLGGHNSNLGTGNLYNAIQSALGASPVPLYCVICLGANDSRDFFSIAPSQYGANLVNICNALNGNGIVPLLCYPTWQQDGADGIMTETSMERLLNYLPQIDAIPSGGQVFSARAGDKRAFYYGANNINTFEGSTPATTPNQGIHPNQDGGADIGEFWGLALAQVL